MDLTDYKSAACSVSYGSQLSGDEAEKMVGQPVTHVQASEYGLKLTFANGSILELSGTTYGDGPLGVEFTEKQS
jgi:hypothetical protein